MKIKIRLKIIVDIMLLLSGLASAITGIMLLISSPGPSTCSWFNRGRLISDITSRHSLKIFHDWGSIIFISFVIFHLILNWPTIICYFKSVRRNIAKKESV
jgi:hypothetical protein